MKKAIEMVGFALLIGGSVLLLSTQVNAQSLINENSTQIKSVNKEAATVYLEVDGMSCQRFCANGTDTVLKHEPGILFSKTTYATSSSVVKYDPALITPEKIMQAIDKRGFKAKIKKEK